MIALLFAGAWARPLTQPGARRSLQQQPTGGALLNPNAVANQLGITPQPGTPIVFRTAPLLPTTTPGTGAGTGAPPVLNSPELNATNATGNATAGGVNGTGLNATIGELATAGLAYQQHLDQQCLCRVFDTTPCSQF